jgi:hypothetical protein
MSKQSQKLKIDFLYLDLSTCDRCQATDKVLDDALDELRNEIKDVKELVVSKIKITSDKEAKEYDFVRSPTIRINGVDVEEILSGKLEIKDNYCKSCESGSGRVCKETTGGGTQCRVVEYKGKTYEAVPKEMIKDAVRKVLGIEVKKDAPRDNPKDSCCVSKKCGH